MAANVPENVIAQLGKHFGGMGVTWTIAKGQIAGDGQLKEVVIIVFETGSGTIGVTLAKADAQRFMDSLRTTMAGIIVANNGGGATP